MARAPLCRGTCEKPSPCTPRTTPCPCLAMCQGSQGVGWVPVAAEGPWGRGARSGAGTAPASERLNEVPEGCPEPRAALCPLPPPARPPCFCVPTPRPRTPRIAQRVPHRPGSGVLGGHGRARGQGAEPSGALGGAPGLGRRLPLPLCVAPPRPLRPGPSEPSVTGRKAHGQPPVPWRPIGL